MFNMKDTEIKLPCEFSLTLTLKPVIGEVGAPSLFDIKATLNKSSTQARPVG
jgi:hypothetical protein